jgi:hypothetical protein
VQKEHSTPNMEDEQMDCVNPYDESTPVHEREAWLDEQRLQVLEDSLLVIDILKKGNTLPSQEMANVNSRCVTLAKAYKMLERLGGSCQDELTMPMFSEEGKIEHVKVSDLIQIDQDALDPYAVLYPCAD